MDCLDEKERELAWKAIWQTSFSGIAIVNGDYTFRAVNPQFCRILQVTAGELIGNKFTDITPIEIRELDVKNAELVKAGVISSYVLPKSYEFATGHKVHVTLLVKGVYCETSSEFLFFVFRIMEDKKITLSAAQSQKPTELLEWIDKKKIGMGFLALLAALGYGVVKYFIEKFN